MAKLLRALAAVVVAGLLVAPIAADAKKARAGRHHHGLVAVTPAYRSVSPSAMQPRAPYGSSGQAVGTVTAPSIGSYNWPSVGVTNAVPTWSNTTR